MGSRSRPCRTKKDQLARESRRNERLRFRIAKKAGILGRGAKQISTGGKYRKVYRNDPCSCGSGLKAKKCLYLDENGVIQHRSKQS